MSNLTEPMKRLIRNFSVGAVATINEDGTPAVSPKATFVVVDDECIAFGNIRIPRSWHDRWTSVWASGGNDTHHCCRNSR